MEPRTTACAACGDVALATDRYCASCGAVLGDAPEPYLSTWTSPPPDPLVSPAQAAVAVESSRQPDFVPLDIVSAPPPDYIPLRIVPVRHAPRPGLIRRLGHSWRPRRLRPESPHH